MQMPIHITDELGTYAAIFRRNEIAQLEDSAARCRASARRFIRKARTARQAGGFERSAWLVGDALEARARGRYYAEAARIVRARAAREAAGRAQMAPA